MAEGFDIKACWWRLPLVLRQRWWRETDYGRKPPSEELKAAIEQAEREVG